MNDRVRTAGQTAISIKKIPGVAPLYNFGVFPVVCVPEALQSVLFGQPDPQRTMNTFAILDAARIPDLAEQLAHSGLAHRCLFKGDAEEDLGAVAPWIVELTPSGPFTASLFTDGEAPWELWGKEAGFFVRNAATLDDMWRHFRKFTRVRDEAGDWFFLRFWEPRVMALYLEWMSRDHDRIRQWFHSPAGGHMTLVTVNPKSGNARAHTAQAPVAQGLPNSLFVLDDRERAVFRFYKWNRFVEKLGDHLAGSDADFAALDHNTQLGQAGAFAQQAYGSGLRIESAVADFALAAWISQGAVTDDAVCARILAGADHETDKARKLLAEAHSRLARRTHSA